MTDKTQPSHLTFENWDNSRDKSTVDLHLTLPQHGRRAAFYAGMDAFAHGEKTGHQRGFKAGKVQSGQDTQLTPEQAKAIQATIANWDSTTAVQRVVEELQELSLALLHWSRDRVPYTHVKSEMADVHIALRHLEFRFGEYQAFLADKIKKGCLPPPSGQQETD